MRYMRRDEGASWPCVSVSAATRSSWETAEKGTTLAVMKHHLLLVDYRLFCTHSDVTGQRINLGDRDSQADEKERNPFLFALLRGEVGLFPLSFNDGDNLITVFHQLHIVSFTVASLSGSTASNRLYRSCQECIDLAGRSQARHGSDRWW